MKREQLIELLNDMSLEEKVNQMLQVVGGFYTGETVATGPMKDNGFSDENVAQAGAVLSTYGARKVKKIQKEYIEKHPHRIPLLFTLDVINGFRTVFPIPLAQGATFDPELSRKCASIAAKEAAVSGVHVTFSPMVDLVRDARWGRVLESTGEDTYLNGLFAKAMVRGYQGDNLSDEYKIAACVKHFAGYGAPVAGRDYNNVELSKHTLKEFYLPAYKAGIDAGAALVMTSFNTIEGIPATGSKWLMRDILRDEMGFMGVLISDWAAMEQMVDHGYCENLVDAAKRSIEAGVDIDMMTGTYSGNLCQLIRSGEVKEELLDEAVLRILELKNKLGLFENPYKDADEEKEKEIILCEEHKELARQAAKESFVLLENSGLLPLKKEQKVAFIGPYVDNRNMLGAWSIIGRPEDVTTIKEALLEKDYGENITFGQGSKMLDEGVIALGFTEYKELEISLSKEKMINDARKKAKEAEVVVLAIGEHSFHSGEANSKADITIPKVQIELLSEMAKVNENIVVVLFSGRPIDIRDVKKYAKSILHVWMPGTEGARAIVDTLYGDFNPQGKLSMSFPYCVGQVPVHYNEYPTGRPHIPGKDMDRFRSKYVDIPNAPLYPFGYGLSYTRFDISKVSLDKEAMTREDSIMATVNVKNIGSVKGTETVQLYIHDVAASVVRPVKELKAFKKITLEPGEEAKVVFEINNDMLKFISENGCYESENGRFEVFVGADSRTMNSASFWLK